MNNSGKVDVLELDIYAKVFDSTSVNTTLVECKRGCTFNDLFLFVGISNLINANNNIMVALSKQLEDIKIQADKLNVTVLEPLELYNKINPNQEAIFSMFYLWNEIKYSIMSKDFIKLCLAPRNNLSRYQQNAYNEVRAYLSLINGKVWREPNLILRAQSFTDLLTSHKDFVRKVARIQKLSPANKNSQYYIDSNEICQAAGALVLDIKLAYIVCAVECAILKIDTNDVKDIGFNNLVTKLASKIEIAVLIPKFLQYFINIFGGIYFNNLEDIKNICNIIKISPNQFNDIILLLKELFILPEIMIQWGFEEDFLVTNLKYTPSLYKAIGIENRQKMNFNISMFVQKDVWQKKLEDWRLKNEVN
ncbi:hypothetical protein [Tissierella pigra]|uniref:hypothetical protein n=1 Tax=Tissierella pigra TaxID=2607614 RepID=UPI0018A6CFCA|nr:hypothetical protein [Tissierella pigra]